MDNVVEISHPLVQHHLCKLRDKSTSSPVFRRIVHRLTVLVSYEATKDLETVSIDLETPMEKTQGRTLKPRVGIIPILRAGLGMVEPVLDLVPQAEVWHLGFYRDEETFQPVPYYKKLPQSDPVDVALVLDPMLATGGSAVEALKSVYDWGVKRVKLIAMIAAPEGVEKVLQEFPDTQIYVTAIDRCLNEKAYILPGLGDAGDRIFNARA